MSQALNVTVNGDQYDIVVPHNWTLAQLLKDQMGLSGTKDGCRQGVCGSCTVLVDGLAVRACLQLAVRCQGKQITTVEGLKEDGKLSRLQQAFVDAGAVQCGYCTPGMLIMASALLRDNPAPSEQQVREALVGNLCRCTGYNRIVQAVMAAAGQGIQP